MKKEYLDLFGRRIKVRYKA